ncbi:high affinity cGMP-specific 3',5'-cyclic phosphodiesterase 9A-like [Planoprotostelium fungivorum]|uniref:Phosphodiesterase n=1 Tax=Planoprotostelium fungivorum TaxID=1890364 RepID=A0A2P6NSW8_9EUKA|nr:high affinity cGMP-specific 3',5'-cyclic phosphodiesterase 9A-like [Planoprotostelium fungivorum]
MLAPFRATSKNAKFLLYFFLPTRQASTLSYHSEADNLNTSLFRQLCDSSIYLVINRVNRINRFFAALFLTPDSNLRNLQITYATRRAVGFLLPGMEEPDKLRVLTKLQQLQEEWSNGKKTESYIAQENVFWAAVDQEYALGPSQLHLLEDRRWTEDSGWSKAEKRNMLETLDFDPYLFEREEHKLLVLTYEMFDSLGLIDRFKVPRGILQNFLLQLQASYRRIPFHNFFHSYNVTHTVYYFLTVCNVKNHLGQIELFALLLSALCHDIDHPGLNNTFLSNAKTDMGSHYNDFSVLEQHHCHKTFEMLGKPECNVLINLNHIEATRVRKYIAACILATDLSVHGPYLAQLKQMQTVDWSSTQDKELIMCGLIKCADISNEIRPTQIGRRWAQRVMTEFFAQSSLEKEKGLPVAPHMDPTKTTTATGQIGFITYLGLPLFNELTRLFPNMKVCCDQMIENRANWERERSKKTGAT